MRSRSARPPRLRPGCSPTLRRNHARRRRTSRIRHRTHRSSPNASPASHRNRLSSVAAPSGPEVRIPLAPAARQSANHRFRWRFYGESDRLEWAGNRGLSCRGTRSSNPSPSSRQSVSLRISLPLLKKPGFSAIVGTRQGSTVGRDAQSSAILRRREVVSLPGEIPVPLLRMRHAMVERWPQARWRCLGA